MRQFVSLTEVGAKSNWIFCLPVTVHAHQCARSCSDGARQCSCTLRTVHALTRNPITFGPNLRTIVRVYVCARRTAELGRPGFGLLTILSSSDDSEEEEDGVDVLYAPCACGMVGMSLAQTR